MDSGDSCRASRAWVCRILKFSRCCVLAVALEMATVSYLFLILGMLSHVVKRSIKLAASVCSMLIFDLRA